VVTNIGERQAERLIEWHREKAGTIEGVPDVWKHELGAGVMPSQYFGANAAWLRLAAIRAQRAAGAAEAVAVVDLQHTGTAGASCATARAAFGDGSGAAGRMAGSSPEAPPPSRKRIAPFLIDGLADPFPASSGRRCACVPAFRRLRPEETTHLGHRHVTAAELPAFLRPRSRTQAPNRQAVTATDGLGVLSST